MSGTIVLNEVSVRDDEQQYLLYKQFIIQNPSTSIITLLLPFKFTEIEVTFVKKATSAVNLYSKLVFDAENTADALYMLSLDGLSQIIQLSETKTFKFQSPISRVDVLCDTAEAANSTMIIINGAVSYV
jgi:hypothetical protein